jgi:hypothetical protein
LISFCLASLRTLLRKDKDVFVAAKKRAAAGAHAILFCYPKIYAQQNSEVVRVLQCRDALRAGECDPPSQRGCVGSIRKSNKIVTNLSLAISQELTVFAIAIK